MKQAKHILAVNTGSSSIKFALYDIGASEELVFSGSLTRIGLEGSRFTLKDAQGKQTAGESVSAESHDSACEYVFSRILSIGGTVPDAVGHRMVHGGPDHADPEMISPELTTSLTALIPYAPEHLPQALKAVNRAGKVFPGVPQVACFDTAFHRTMPAAAQLYPLPESVRNKGVQRYGFHGLSYEYLVGELERREGSGALRGRVILAHLGHGASMAAVLDGKSIDTTMGFSPAGGMAMGTRTGDLDPGVILFLLQQENMDPAEVKDMVNRRSGLLGVSGKSGNMRDLIEDHDPASRLAVELFCYQAGKCIGGFAAALGGLDTLVFTGGIGEKAAEIRRRICEGLAFLGISIDAEKNAANSTIISRKDGTVTVRVMETKEELMIARRTYNLLKESL